MKKLDKGLLENITSLGIGITSLCNLSCPHCYSRKLVQKNISFIEFKKNIIKFPNLKKVNFGTGESILNEDLLKIIKFLDGKKIEMALTSNGLSVKNLKNYYLKKFKDIDISLDFPIASLHDKWRGKSGTFDTAIKAIEKCKKLGLKVSIAMALMNNNYKYLSEFKKILDKYDIPLRINLYKPVFTKKYLLSYQQFWKSIKTLSKKFELISNSEPLLELIVDEKLHGSPCGNSARMHPNGEIVPCVYLSGKFGNFEKFKKTKLQIPEKCAKCHVANLCRGGCLGRRLLTYSDTRPDQYCPIINKRRVPKINFIKTFNNDFMHSEYLCTIIVR